MSLGHRPAARLSNRCTWRRAPQRRAGCPRSRRRPRSGSARETQSGACAPRPVRSSRQRGRCRRQQRPGESSRAVSAGRAHLTGCDRRIARVRPGPQRRAHLRALLDLGTLRIAPARGPARALVLDQQVGATHRVGHDPLRKHVCASARGGLRMPRPPSSIPTKRTRATRSLARALARSRALPSGRPRTHPTPPDPIAVAHAPRGPRPPSPTLVLSGAPRASTAYRAQRVPPSVTRPARALPCALFERRFASGSAAARIVNECTNPGLKREPDSTVNLNMGLGST